MISINNVPWNELTESDIESFLNDYKETESNFFEFKSKGLNSKSLSKEISALSNTFGGYIFIGVEDDKTITGVGDWTEERVHNVIYNTVSPLPLFSIKEFTFDSEALLLIRIEEGPNPPYIANDGHIYQRLSSGSYPIKDSNALLLLYNKRRDNDNAIASRIELPSNIKDNVPNLIGFIDLGFVLYCSNALNFEVGFRTADFATLAKEIRDIYSKASVIKIGQSLVINFNLIHSNLGDMIPAGIDAYLEVYNDGSVRMRLPLVSNNHDGIVDLSPVLGAFGCIERIYHQIIGDDLIDKFIYAKKYNQLHLFYEIEPHFDIVADDKVQSAIDYAAYVIEHKNKFGLNKVINGNRVPTCGFQIIDKELITSNGNQYDMDSLVGQLFYSHFELMGFIDDFNDYKIEDKATLLSWPD